MTDVVTHAEPTPPGEGRRSTRRHRHLGLRVPHGGPATDGAHGPDGLDDPRVDVTPDDAGPRHRRAPGTAPIAVPTTAETSRHRAAHRGEAFDPATGSIPTAVSPTVAVPTTERATHRPAHGGARTSVTASPTAAAGPTATGASGHGPAHGADAPRRTVPLRATVALLGVGGVAAVFALTTPGAPAPAPAPVEAPPQLAAPAGLASPVLPSPPASVALSPLPAAPATPVTPPATSTTPTAEAAQPVVGALFDAAAGAFSDLFDNSANRGLVEDGPKPRVVDNPDAPGRDAWQFSLGPGGFRSEVLPQGEGTEPTVGDEQYVRYTAQLSDDFPTDTGEWQVILQWHHTSPNGSPPLALQITRGQLYMVSNGDDMQAIGPVSPGQRIDLTMRIKFSQDPGEGAVTVWRDGRSTGVTGWSPREGTMSTRDAYLKMGLYRSQRIREGGSILVTDLKIGRDAEGIGGTGPRPGA